MADNSVVGVYVEVKECAVAAGLMAALRAKSMAGMLLFLCLMGVGSSWWNSSYGYATPCTVNTNVASSLSEYPYYCIVNTAALISAGKMNSSCQDLRPIDNTNTTELLYEIDTGTCNTNWTVVNFGMNTTAGGSDIVQIYSGNPSVSTTQNPTLLWTRANYTFRFSFGENGTLINSAGGANLSSSNNATCVVNFANGTRGMGGSMFSCYWNNAGTMTGYPTGEGDSTETVWYKHSSNTGTVPALYAYGQYASLTMRGLSYYPGGTALRYETYTIFAQNTAWTFPTNTFQHYATRWQDSNNTAYIFRNGTIIGQGNKTTLATTANTEMVIGSGVGNKANWGTMAGQIDEFRVRNVASTNDWILAEYGQTYSVGETVAYSYEPIYFVSQNTSNITATNLFAEGIVNITYNTTATNSTPYLFYKTNSTSSDCFIYVNGSQACGWLNVSGTNMTAGSGAQIAWLFRVDRTNIYPGTSNMDENDMENVSKSAYLLDSSEIMVKAEFKNVTARQFSIISVYVGNASPSFAGIFYYCNSSGTGDPATSNNCTEIYRLQSAASYNYTRELSSHYLIPLVVNTTSNTVGDVQFSATSYIVFRSGDNGSWNAYYAPNITRAGAAQASTNSGATWYDINGTFDMELYQFAQNDTFYYYASVDAQTSAERNDTLEFTDLPPTSPEITSPSKGDFYNKTLYIDLQYSQAVSPNGYNISSYNISLLDINQAFVSTVVENNYPYLNYSVNVSEVANGFYYISVDACDLQGQCSKGYSGRFVVASQASVMLNTPENGTIFPTGQTAFTLNWTCTGNNGTLYANLTLDGVLNQSSISSLNNTATSVNKTLSATDHNWSVTCWDDFNSVASSTYSFSVLPMPPVAMFIQVENQNYSNVTVLYNFTAIIINQNQSALKYNLSIIAGDIPLNWTENDGPVLEVDIAQGNYTSKNVLYNAVRIFEDQNFTLVLNVSDYTGSTKLHNISLLLPIDPPSAITLKGGGSVTGVGTLVYIWDGAAWTLFDTEDNQMTFRCSDNFPDLCAPNHQNNNTDQPILKNINNGDTASNFSAIKTNSTWNAASLLCGMGNNSGSAINVTTDMKNFSNSTLAHGESNYLYCWFLIENVTDIFPRNFNISIENG